MIASRFAGAYGLVISKIQKQETTANIKFRGSSSGWGITRSKYGVLLQNTCRLWD